MLQDMPEPTANGIHRPHLSLQPPLFFSFSYIFSFGPKVLIIAVEHSIFFLLCSFFLWIVPSAPASLGCLLRVTLVSDLFSPPHPTPTWPSPVDISLLPSQYLLLSLPLTHTKCLASQGLLRSAHNTSMPSLS